MGSDVVIGKGSVGVSCEWSLEGMIGGRCWVMSGVVGCCWVMCGVVGHSEEEVAVAVECWVEEEEVVVVD